MKNKRMTYILLVLAACCLLFPALAFADDSGNVADWLNEGPAESESVPDEAEAIPQLEEKSLASIIGQLVFYTLLIVGLIYGLIKFLALRQKSMQSNRAIQLLGGTPLGQNKSLQLIKVGGSFYMIGVGSEVTLIKEFSDEAEIAALEQDLEQQRPTAGLFGKGEQGSTPFATFEQAFARSLNKQKQRRLSFGEQEPKDKEERP